MEPSSPLGGRLHHFALHIQAARCARGRRASIISRVALGSTGFPGTGGPGRPRDLASSLRSAPRLEARPSPPAPPVPSKPVEPARLPAVGPTSPGLPAVCAGARRPAREIATRELRSEWSISRPALALPPSTGTATRPPHPAITHVIAEPTPNSACNSPTTISNLEFTALELQRFQTLLKLHPIKLHATFRRASPGTTAHGHRSQALSHFAVSGTGIPRGYPQALFGAGGYPQGFVSAWITRRHARSVFVDGPTRGPTKE